MEAEHHGSASAEPGTPTSNHRKERGAIAAQACENCRARKQKCSEARPKCDGCVRAGIPCKYREPQPTKKDKTLVEILERLKILEGGIKALDGKVDSIGVQPGFSFANHDQQLSAPTTYDPSRSNSWASSSAHLTTSSIGPAAVKDSQYKYASAAFKMLSWPCLKPVLPAVDIPALEKGGASIILGQGENGSSPSLDALNAAPANSSQSLMNTHLGSTNEHHIGAFVPNHETLDWETMLRLSKAYFDSFNFLFPIIDRQHFVTAILPTIARHGYDNSSFSALALLVLALGEVSLAGTQGTPIQTHKGRPSGLRGGSAGQPPGLYFFNRARRNMGLGIAESSLENVQIFSLAALYYGTCCQHTGFWRMTIYASVACQALLISKPDTLRGAAADLVRRAFWHCSIMETLLYLELDLPTTGLEKFEDIVGLPDFSGSYSEEDYVGNQSTHYQEHFASQIVLRRLSVEFNKTLNNVLASENLNGAHLFPPETPRGQVVSTIKQLAMQLEQWRGMLPLHLRWQDDERGVFHLGDDLYDPTGYPHGVPPQLGTFSFTTNLDIPPVNYPYAADIQISILRSRYYYVKHILYRPFLYKALHHPEDFGQEDAEGVAECLQAGLKWPIAMSPASRRKRLIPCLFFWSQNLLSVLVTLRLTERVPLLARIRTNMTGPRFNEDARETVALYIDWIRDLKDVDSTAMWCWTVLQDIYPLDDDA
ncbi:uncharacterized protein B0I36DRAFT_409480 [Microdochium trichocladiopsis]|uniref:Zn(2)-C6 fungal-type domain-containing protein n=1 Tax=Microdochium trichocladiopsis TaxID=1682393 RepID=A0A9P8Y7K6_9PEZI|nr:uncharacterized protein B0I36DRAFT_409480 [Microdochium trichocladiopsis]KAH7031178.1 hypothetical protein B0I36DRAFT_409480 [Microdochium trichocladiopsis]